VKADASEVKKHFRKKMLLVHPDKNGGAPHSNDAFSRVKQVSPMPYTCDP
jgi:curved DNA-binding protein CbpA